MEFSGLTNEGPGYGRRPETADFPSGDALDRAHQIVQRVIDGAPESNAVQIAKLIEAADRAAVTEVKPLQQYLPDAIGRLESRDRVRPRHTSAAEVLLRERPVGGLLRAALAELEWFNWRCDGQRADLNAARERALQTATTDALLEELRRRLNT